MKNIFKLDSLGMLTIPHAPPLRDALKELILADNLSEEQTQVSINQAQFMDRYETEAYEAGMDEHWVGGNWKTMSYLFGSPDCWRLLGILYEHMAAGDMACPDDDNIRFLEGAAAAAYRNAERQAVLMRGEE